MLKQTLTLATLLATILSTPVIAEDAAKQIDCQQEKPKQKAQVIGSEEQVLEKTPGVQQKVEASNLLAACPSGKCQAAHSTTSNHFSACTKKRRI
jgi:hypothetical protein